MARRVKVDLVGDASSLNRAFKSAGLHADKFGHKASRTRRVVGAAWKGIAIGGAAVGVALAEGVKKSIEAADEHEKVMLQTRAALKSTGGAAKVTAGHVDRLANSLQNQIAVSRDDIQASENMLLAFQNVRNEAGQGNKIFDRATTVIQDYAARTGKDAKNAAVIFGKALEDPANKVTALSRAGIIFSETMRNQIKILVEHGNILDAQKLILGELERRYKGAGRAAGASFAGKVKILRLQLRDLEIIIGNALLPIMSKWATSISKWLSKAKNQRKIIHDIRVAAKLMAGTIMVAAKVIGAIVTVIQGYIRVGRRVVTWTKRMGEAFQNTWASAKKHTMSFYNWIQRTGIKIALAIIEPFSHLPGFLGGKKFQKAKEELQGQLQALTPGKAAPPPKHDRHGNVATPVHGAIRAAGGRLRVPDDSRSPHRARHDVIHLENVVNLDGRVIHKSNTKHERRSKRRTTAQRGGRHPGTVLD